MSTFVLLFNHIISNTLILYIKEEDMFCCKFKKLIAGILIGFGIGILLVLFLPPIAWICIMGIGTVIGGIKFLFGK